MNGEKKGQGMNTQMKFTHEEEARKMWRHAESTDHNKEEHRLWSLVGRLTQVMLAFIAIGSSLFWDAFFVRGAGKAYLSTLPGMKQMGRFDPVLTIIGVFFVTMIYYFTVGCFAVFVLPFAGGLFGVLAFGTIAAAAAVFGVAGGTNMVVEFGFTQISGIWAWLAANAPGAEAASAAARMWTHFWVCFGLFAAWTVAAAVMMKIRQAEARRVHYSYDEGYVINRWVGFVPWAAVAVCLYFNGYVLSLFAFFAAASWTIKRWGITRKRNEQAQAVLDAEAKQARLASDAHAIKKQNPEAYNTPLATPAPMAVPNVFLDHEKRFKAAMAYASRNPDSEFNSVLVNKGIKILASSPEEGDSARGKAEAVKAYEMHRAKNEELARGGDPSAEERVSQMRQAEAEVGMGT